MLMFVARVWEWTRGRPIEAKRKGLFWIFSGLAVFLLISALHHAEKGGPTSPDLRGGIDQIGVTAMPDKPSTAAILLVFHVRNVGTPSIVDNYKLTVTLPGWASPIQGIGLFIPKILKTPTEPGVPPPVSGPPFVCGKDALYLKTAEQPLAYGSQERGYLWFELPGVSFASLKNPAGAQFHITFDDVLGKTYAADFSWPSVPIPLGYIPGILAPNGQSPEDVCK